MKRYLLICGIALCSLLVGGVANAAPIVLSGANSAYAADYRQMPFPGEDIVLHANITTGKVGRVLIVTVSLGDRDFSGPGQIYVLRPEVNGTGMILGNSSISSGSNAYFATTVPGTGTLLTSATWWLDIDAAGLANQPLDITVWGQANYASGRTTGINLVAFTELK